MESTPRSEFDEWNGAKFLFSRKRSAVAVGGHKSRRILYGVSHVCVYAL